MVCNFFKWKKKYILHIEVREEKIMKWGKTGKKSRFRGVRLKNFPCAGGYEKSKESYMKCWGGEMRCPWRTRLSEVGPSDLCRAVGDDEVVPVGSVVLFGKSYFLDQYGKCQNFHTHFYLKLVTLPVICRIMLEWFYWWLIYSGAYI